MRARIEVGVGDTVTKSATIARLAAILDGMGVELGATSGREGEGVCLRIAGSRRNAVIRVLTENGFTLGLPGNN